MFLVEVVQSRCLLMLFRDLFLFLDILIVKIQTIFGEIKFSKFSIFFYLNPLPVEDELVDQCIRPATPRPIKMMYSKLNRELCPNFGHPVFSSEF